MRTKPKARVMPKVVCIHVAAGRISERQAIVYEGFSSVLMAVANYYQCDRCYLRALKPRK